MSVPTPFVINGTTYDLSHMAAFKTRADIKLRGGNIKSAPVEVRFSCHCWSRSPVKNEEIPDSHFVYDGSEEMPRHRIFSEHRHELSLALPDFVKNVLATNGRVYETDRDNIMRIDTLIPFVAGPEETKYYIFIKPKKKAPELQQKFISMYVESAYPESVMYDAPRIGKPIFLDELLGDCWEGRFPRARK